MQTHRDSFKSSIFCSDTQKNSAGRGKYIKPGCAAMILGDKSGLGWRGRLSHSRIKALCSGSNKPLEEWWMQETQLCDLPTGQNNSPPPKGYEKTKVIHSFTLTALPRLSKQQHFKEHGQHFFPILCEYGTSESSLYASKCLRKCIKSYRCFWVLRWVSKLQSIILDHHYQIGILSLVHWIIQVQPLSHFYPNWAQSNIKTPIFNFIFFWSRLSKQTEEFIFLHYHFSSCFSRSIS